MSTNIDTGGYLANLGLFMTYKCQVACAHCLVEAGPHRTEMIREDDADDWMAQAARYRNGRIKAINLTGGEPFFDLEALRRLVGIASAHGLFATVATNAYWAVSPAAAFETLSRVPEVLFLQLSADEHHQLSIPFERVLNAIGAAQRLGLTYRVAVCTETRESPDYARTLGRLMDVTDADHVDTVLTFAVGRAAHGRPIRLRAMTATVPAGACAGADSPIVFPDGRVVACIGPITEIRDPHPLVLGSLRERPLADILDTAEANAVLHLIRVGGPATLYEVLRRRGLEGCLPSRFVPDSICDLCHRLMSDAYLREAIGALLQDDELRQAIADGRQRLLKEDGMAPLLAP